MKRNLSVVRPFQKNKKQIDLRTHLNGAALLGELQRHLTAFETIDKELKNSIQDFSRDILASAGKLIRTEKYRSTVLDKETIAVYHTRQAGRKVQIDTVLKMLNKVMPDLKAVETTDDIGNLADRALLAFAAAAKS